MSDSDLCRHCGFTRRLHEWAKGYQGHIYECPRVDGRSLADNFDSVELAAKPLPCGVRVTPGLLGEDESASRKESPLFAGCLSYFPDALLAVSRLSKVGNDKHNPGEPLHWNKGKSADHADCLARHLLTHGKVDPDTGLSHTVAVAWRALALLQTEIEAARKGGAQ